MENLALEPMIHDFLLGGILFVLSVISLQCVDILKRLDWSNQRTHSRDIQKLDRKRARAAKKAKRDRRS